MNAIELYKKFFPLAQPSIFQMELIEGNVTDLEVWQRTLEFWAGNDYRAQSVFKIVEYYKETHTGLVKNGRTLDTVGRPFTAQPYIPDPPCAVCGQDVCFDLHREAA
jgi:hypothetical protein